ncbi:MAG: hypothetical protein ABEK75_02755 [Salinibacter sp.]
MRSPRPTSESGVIEDGRPGGAGGWMAMVLSYVVSPLALPPIVYGTVLVHVGASRLDVIRGAGLAFVFLSLVPLLYVGWMRLRGRIESLEIRDRSKRTEPFLVVLGAGVVAFVVVWGMEMRGRRLIAALVGCHVFNTSLLFLITAWWKISVHCASVAGAVATLTFAHHHVPGTVLDTGLVEGPLLGGGVVLVLTILWARVRSRAHTLGQAVAGTGLGLAPYVELFALAQWIEL